MDRANAKTLMRLHLRLAAIKREIEFLENPDTRRMYEEINFPAAPTGDTPNTYIVSRHGTIAQHLSYLEAVKKSIPDEKLVDIVPSLLDCTKISGRADQICLPIGLHKVNPLRVLNSNGSIRAFFDNPNAVPSMVEGCEPDPTKSAIITAVEEDSFLLGFNGAYTLENILLDCRNVRTGLWLRNGTVKLKNCMLVGDEKSATGIGIRVSNGAILELDNCVIEKFSYGICCDSSSNITLINTKLVKCETGLEATDETQISIKLSSALQSKSYGFVLKSGDDVKRVCSDLAEAKNANA